jgi:RecA/RadA recombinase
MRKINQGLRPGFRTADEVIRLKLCTGNPALDRLLDGGIERGLVHLFYGDRGLHDDLLRIAVQAQLPEDKGGIRSSSIIIDSANVIHIDQLTDISYELDLEPELVMDRIYISRAFNSSQTYDLVMNQIDKFFDRVPARVLFVTGLPNLFIKEGISGKGLQQLTHMATKIMTFTLQRGIFTVISAQPSEQNRHLPAGGKALASCAQVHVHVEESKSYFKYILAKHPQYPVRRSAKAKQPRFGTTLPLSYFDQESEEKD